jgi:hypothetical protein
MFDYKRALVEFLAAPENFPVALEIGSHIEQVKDLLQAKFWEELQQEVTERLTQADLAQEWRLTANTPRQVDDWHGYTLRSTQPDIVRNNVQLSFSLQQSTRRDNYRLYYGFSWNHSRQNAPDIEAIRNLQAQVEPQGLRPSPPHHPAIKYLDDCVRSDDFLMAVAHDTNHAILHIVDEFWTFFNKWYAAVVDINLALVNDQSQPFTGPPI